MALTGVMTLLNKYHYKEWTTTDVTDLIGVYRDLKPGAGMCVFSDGTAKEMVNLSGTIPVPYKGMVYNIPVEVWLFNTHPYNPPICYVKPTSNMLIKEGRHVDVSGRIYLPYLHEWNPSKSNLLGLIEVMVVVFAEAPPVFSRASSVTTTPVVRLPVTPPHVGGIYPGFPHYPWDPAAKPPTEGHKPTAVAAAKRPAEEHQPAAVAAVAADADKKQSENEEELKRLQEQHTCKVCLDKEVSIVFVPCGHLVACQDCAPSLPTCPICRAVVKEAVRTFML